jgi:hypothetical protein
MEHIKTEAAAQMLQLEGLTACLWLAAVSSIFFASKKGFGMLFDYQCSVLITILYLTKTGFIIILRRAGTGDATTEAHFHMQSFNPFFSDFIIVFLHFSNDGLNRSYRFVLFITF